MGGNFRRENEEYVCRLVLIKTHIQAKILETINII